MKRTGGRKTLNNVHVFVLLALALSCTPKAADTEQTSQKPNIVLIMADDQGWGDLSLTGNPDLSTPNIDQLAKNGVLFENFYVSPVCSPTRAELLTGRFAARGGVYSVSQGLERLDLDETTVADLFKENGYKTAAFGKWHNGMQYPYHPNGRGFDEFYGYCSGHWGSYFSPMLERNGQIVQGEGFLTDDLTNKAIRFIEENKDQPFFLYLPLNTPHSPMQVPDKWWSKFENKTLTNTHPNKDKEDIMHTKAAYAMCENIDWNVGRVEEKLKELGLEENTIVIYLSDNGPNGNRWNDGLKGKKGETDEGGVKSPFIINWKGTLEAGQKVTQIATALDILPTLAALAQIDFEPNKPLDGRSLKPLLLEENPTWEDRNIVSNWMEKISVRNQQFRLDNKNRLYDMQADPGQTQDVTEQYPAQWEEMVQHKNKWVTEVLSELPAEDTRPIPVAHPDFNFTQLPARDAIAYGNIERSNQWPNCSFYTNWTDVTDSITWDIEVLEKGSYEAIVYYTCAPENVGALIELSFGPNSVQQTLSVAHDPPLMGAENDRVPRGESYVKDFIPLNLGRINLEKGKGTLTLRAPKIKGTSAMDFRLLMINR